MNEQAYRIIGVAPRGFTFPSTGATPGEPPDLWAPLSFTSDQLRDWASSFDTSIIARLKDGVSVEQARDDVRSVAAGFQREHPEVYSGNIRIQGEAELWSTSFEEPWVSASIGRIPTVLWILCGAAGFVLLIACANGANLLLARATARHREMSVRRALGATPGRLVRQMLTETALLTTAGGAIGYGLAYSLLRAIDMLGVREINARAATVDARVLLFTFVLCSSTCLLCGLAPAWMLRSSNLPIDLGQSARSSGTSRSLRRMGRFLILTEITCAVILLIGSTLHLRSFLRVLQVPLGFDPKHALVMRTEFNRQRYASSERRHAAERAIEARLASLPGVSAAALTTHLPLADSRGIGFALDGRPPGEFHWADNALVSANYFRAMGIPLQRGRGFVDTDAPGSPLVAVINQTMAAQFWPGQNPIGKGFRWGGRHLNVIGVAADVHVQAPDRPVAPTIYNSVYQIESGASTSAVFLMRTSGERDPMGLFAAARNVLRSVDPGLPILNVTTLRRVVSGALSIRRASLALADAFAVLAMVLACIGIYGLVSHAVTQRTQEIGVRVALGARPAEIKRLVIGEGIGLALIGIAVGIVGGAIATRFLTPLLFGIRSLDPLSFALGILLLMAVVFLGSYIPARRASKVDPMVALRHE